MAQTGILLVLTRSKDPARRDEFRQWYDTVHIPHVLGTRTPGLTAANRFENLAAEDGRPTSAAIYEFSADPEATFEEMKRRMDEQRAAGATYTIDCLDIQHLAIYRRIF